MTGATPIRLEEAWRHPEALHALGLGRARHARVPEGERLEPLGDAGVAPEVQEVGGRDRRTIREGSTRRMPEHADDAVGVSGA